MSKKLLKSPLRYPGGKSKAIKSIAPLIPDFEEYREPFLGGGSVFVYTKQLHPRKKFWVNDLYKELSVLWKMAKKDIDGLIEQINDWKDEFEVGKELYRFVLKKLKEGSDVEIAAAFFILNRITFSGTSESGGYSEQAFKKRFTDSSIYRLLNLKPILKKVKITNWDFQRVIKKEGKDVFIFLDPPYYSATKSKLYGKNGNMHKGFEHERFAEVVKNSPHKWLITYDDCEYIRDLFSFANIVSWDITYGMRNVSEVKQKEKEIFIANYDIENRKAAEQMELFS